MQTVFLTGGSGFVGRALIAELAARGTQVRALARSAAAAATVRALGAAPVTGDLAAADAMREGMRGADVVIHAAAKVAMWGKREDFYTETIVGTRNALTAARDAGVPRFVHIGTEAVLAGGTPIIGADETAPYPAVPNGLYPWSKGQAERDVIAANRADFITISTRPRFIWGRGDTTLLPNIVKAMQSGAWAWFGGGHHLTSTCHVRNVVEGVLLAAEHGRGGEIYFLTDGAPLDFRDFVTRLAATQGIMAPAREMPMWLADAAAASMEFAWQTFGLAGQPPIMRTIVNLLFREVTLVDRKARTELGYASHVSVEQGLAELSADHEMK
ncbi:MAG TPA: NAD-dependent epimerase/dehydratase family protein [Acetobacteraceae bacterium]|nr:NAD-dependent epimerase/dehydratase family protein [Acetobacteraceae bacterium]